MWVCKNDSECDRLTTHRGHVHTSTKNQIEYGIKRMLGAVDEKVPVITTIRDEQLVLGLVPKGESVLQHDVRVLVDWLAGWSSHFLLALYYRLRMHPSLIFYLGAG